MVRPAGRGSGRGRPATPSSAQKQLGAFYGFSGAQTSGLLKAMGVNDPAVGLTVSASQGQFSHYEVVSLINSQDTMRYYTTDKKRGRVKNLAGEALAPGAESDIYYVDSQGNFVDRSIYRQSYDIDDETGELIIPGEAGPQFGESDAPAALTVVPTSTSNPQRPRTVAAGYDQDRGVITVVFRDGTFYNYYEVTPTQWQQFKARVSKGKYIYQELDYHPRGPASVTQLSATARKALYKFARGHQIYNNGKTKRTTKPK